MAILKCTFCGGDFEVNADSSVGKCKYCDSIITIPKELDRKGNLYNRAIFLRQIDEFDKAADVYEDILKEDNSDAEAHWGLVLSKFGIEYVMDPKTQERIPTCHRVQTQSILADPDYLAAIKHSDKATQEVIKNEAIRIDKIQTRILQISRNEEPYDIFICYKETDESGERTEDSVLAWELYDKLTKRGYRVFYAPKSLGLALGKEYEPFIFAALTSAKVMIVLGTKKAYFDAVWVKNEWSRFIHMSKESHKVIIPAYRGMSPYELPTELSPFQAQDMSKIGFMQELIDGIERCMRDETNQKSSSQEPAQAFDTTPLTRLLQNCDTFLKLGNYDAAEDVYTTVTTQYPEDYRGWWGLIVCNTRNFSKKTIDIDSKAGIKINKWFGYVKQLLQMSSPEEFGNLENQYTEYLNTATNEAIAKATAEDMETIKKRISSYNDVIQIKQSNIQWLKDTNTFIAKSDTTMLDEIRNMENSLYNDKRMLSKKIKCVVLGISLMALGFIGLWYTYRHSWLENFVPLVGYLEFGVFISGYIFLCIGICVPKKHKERSFENLHRSISDYQERIAKTKKEYEAEKKRWDSERAANNGKICNIENEVAVLNEKIACCRNYLELEEDKIYEFWFSKECERFGKNRPFDRSIQELRNAAFEACKEDDDSISIICPHCGKETSTSISILADNAIVSCGNCGNEILVG